MTVLRRKLLLKAFKVVDLLIMAFSFALATLATHYPIDTISFVQFLTMRVKLQNFILFLAFLFVWHIIFSFFGLYHSRRLSTRWVEVIDIIKASSLGILVIFLVSILFRIDIVTPLFLGVFWAGATSIAVISRLVLRLLLNCIRAHGRNLRQVLIVGTNPRAVRFARKIEAKPELGYQLIGFVDDEWPGIGEFRKTSYALVADFNDFPGYLRDCVVDEVVIGLPMNSLYQKASRIAALCEEQGVITRVLSSIFELKRGLSKLERFDEELIITLHAGAMESWPVLVKRTLDFSLSLALIMVLAPLFFISAVLIKVTCPGSVFFAQERIGLNKRRFRLYKFRTMVQNAEQKLAELEHLNEVRGPAFKIKDDPRITPIGKFLRKTSIDELPQLINVVKGEMSLVGPRPLPVRDYKGFDQDWQRRRFSVRPGITCLWQIDGRSSIPFEKWMELDMQYIDQWSLWLDFKILAKTVPAVLRASGAS